MSVYFIIVLHAVGVCRLSSSAVCHLFFLLSSVTQVCGRSGGQHCTTGWYDYVPLGRHLAFGRMFNQLNIQVNSNQVRVEVFLGCDNEVV